MQARREGAERLIEIKRLADAKSQLNQKLAVMQGAWTTRFEVDSVPFVASLCVCESTACVLHSYLACVYVWGRKLYPGAGLDPRCVSLFGSGPLGPSWNKHFRTWRDECP